MARGDRYRHRTCQGRHIELTLLDCVRWFHKAGGVSQVAQIAQDVGAEAKVPRLKTLSRAYENAAAMRPGHFLELAGHKQQAGAHDQLAQEAKSANPPPRSSNPAK